MRRRALCAASAASEGGGGDFYCHCVQNHPMPGYPPLRDETFTFTIESNKTWLECNGLYDNTNSAYIDIFAMPTGRTVLSVQMDSDDNVTAFAPVVVIDVNSPIVIGNTYEFYY